MADQFKDITIGDNRYQIRAMDPRIGSWIVMQVATYILPSGMDERVVGDHGSSLSSSRTEMTEPVFHNLQDHCLGTVRRYEAAAPDNPPVPVFVNGRFAFKDLEQDPVGVLELTIQALVFNLSPFFSAGALQRLLAPLAGLMPSNAPR